ncbi:thromboxane A2 receptor isoform X1 [Gadus chalcogrammus]|uniref:thromboxane A2 receptor isoform X1 n=1 Tax=Gadus chalcogrammus TaxID=1042646 RepID=UPI0024C4CC4B|nr:thromboxane A2 receptor isoform X1 [Gadus chalcogrammus]XP_056459971.1 thromboxane A2 receptor isoform X1 [Gadus chalcogrammus]
MNASSSPAGNESTPLCYSINTPPFNRSSTAFTLSAVFSSLGLTSNLIALVVLAKAYQRTRSRSRSFFLTFLGGLVTTDFMGLLVTGTIVLTYYLTGFDWRQLDPRCHFCNFFGMSMVFYGLCPLLLGAAMAIERFVGINRPFARSASMPGSRAVCMVLVVWTFAGGLALLPLAGVGSYHLQPPGSWCFINISSRGGDRVFSLLFSAVGLASIAVSLVLNTVSVGTLVRVCCGQDRGQRRRDYEVEMMVQLLLIMVIATLCWCPLLVFIAQTVLSGRPLQIRRLLLFLRFATCNQILDPWVYILFRRAVLQRFYPSLRVSRDSIMSLYPSLRRMTRRSPLAGARGRLSQDEPPESITATATPTASALIQA